MAITLNSTIYAGASWTEKSTTDVSTLTDAGTLSIDGELQHGTGNKQANTIWHDTQTLPSGQSGIIDLFALNRTLFGDSYDVSFSGGLIKSISINNIGTGHIALDFSTTNAFTGPTKGGTGEWDIPGQSCITISNMLSGWTSDTSNQYLRINDTDGSGTQYEIVVIGITGI